MSQKWNILTRVISYIVAVLYSRGCTDEERHGDDSEDATQQWAIASTLSNIGFVLYKRKEY